MSVTRFFSIVLVLCPLSPLAAASAQEPQPAARTDKAGDPLPAGAGIRLGTTRFRHTGPITIVGYSRDGGTLITHSDDSYLRFWDVGTGREAYKLEVKATSRRYSIRGTPSVMISGDASTLALGVEDGHCTMMDVATRKTIKEFKLDTEMRNPFGDESAHNYLSYDGRVLVTVDGDRFGGTSKVSVWDTAAGKALQHIQPREKGDVFQAACLSRDGKTLAVVEGPSERRKGEAPGKIQFRFLDAASGAEQRAFPCPVNSVIDMALVADGKALMVRSRNEGVRLLDAAGGKEIRQFPGKRGTIRGAWLAPDLKTLFIADQKHITQYDVAQGKELRQFSVAAGNGEDEFNPFMRGMGGSGFSAAVTADGKTLAVPDQSSIAFWDIPSGKENMLVRGHRNRIDSVAFGPVGKLLTSSADGTVLLWDAATSTVLLEFMHSPKSPKDDMMGRRGGEKVDYFKVRASLSPDGKSVAGLWWGGKLHVWDIQTGKVRHLLGGSRNYTGYSFSANGKFVSLVTIDGTVELWDTVSGREVRTLGAQPAAEPLNPDMAFDGAEMGAFSTAFSPDDRMVISSGIQIGQRGLKVLIQYWELASGQERIHSETRVDLGSIANIDSVTSALDLAVVRCSFAPNAKWVAEAGFGNIRLRDLRTGAEVRSFGGKQVTARTALFSPDGKMLVAGKHDGALRLWDVATGTVLMDFPAHHAQITALDFSPDGRLLMTGAADTSALVWDWHFISKQAAARKTEPAQPDFERLWADLAGKDAVQAYAAIRGFATAPASAISFLKARLRPVPPADPKILAKLIEDLDHPQYATRQKAQAALDKLGDLAADAIKDRLARSPSAEMAARLTELQKKLDAPTTTAEILQALRAVEILELIDTAETRAMLDALAQGAPGHRVTLEARSSLKRRGQSSSSQ